MTSLQIRGSHRGTTSVACAVLVAAAFALSACGRPERGTRNGCVVVDVSGSARAEITGMYLPGFQRFVQRMSTDGSGNVCFAFAAKGMSGGASSWARFACENPSDRLRCGPQVRGQVNAAATQLASVASGPDVLHGASEIAEALALIAPATKDGDEILVLSDVIENSELLGNFADLHTDLGERAIRGDLDALQQRRLLPDLRGRQLRMPYALTLNARRLTMSAARQQQVRTFWERYAQRTQAHLTFGGGDEAA
jgi:hypothetical protein